MTIEDKIIEAQNRFIDGCWKKFKDYYIPNIKNKNIILYGNGIYGKFLFEAFAHIGYRHNIKFIINDFVSSIESYKEVPVVKYCDISINDYEDIIVVGIQNADKLIDKLQSDGHKYIFADASQSFFQDNLMGSVYKCIDMSVISDVFGRIKYYYENMLDKEDYIVNLYEEDLSKTIIKNRLMFYKTGDCKYIDLTPIAVAEYFSEDFYHITDNEVYVDCGAYDGDSILSFIDYVDGRYDKIFGFEPDSISFEKLNRNLASYSNVNCLPYATGSENGEIQFESTGTLGSSSLNSKGEIVEVKRLDDLLSDEKITLIKIDVEGAELDTLKGLAEIIRTQKPKMAVCIYHLMDDIINIPEYLHELVPEYSFKVRQHVDSILDTVLYAEVQ